MWVLGIDPGSLQKQRQMRWWGRKAAVRCAEKAQTARVGIQSRQVCLLKGGYCLLHDRHCLTGVLAVFTDPLICLAFKEKPKNVRFTVVVVIITITYYYCEHAHVSKCAHMEPPCRPKMSELLCDFPEF